VEDEAVNISRFLNSIEAASGIIYSSKPEKQGNRSTKKNRK